MVKRSILSTILVLPLAAITLHAQQSTILGKVEDASGAAVVGAQITATTEGGATFHTVSDKIGLYQFPSLAASNFTVKTEMPGFSTVVEKVTVLVGQSVTANFTLSAGSSTQVEVTADIATIDTTTSQVSGNTDPQTMAKIPLNGRN